MRAPVFVVKTLALLAAAVAVFALFFVVEQPWFSRWGTTDAERPPGAPVRA